MKVHEFDIGGGLAHKKGPKRGGGAFLWTLLPSFCFCCTSFLLFFLPPSSPDDLAHLHSDTHLMHAAKTIEQKIIKHKTAEDKQIVDKANY